MFDFPKRLIRPAMTVALGFAIASMAATVSAETCDLAINAAKFTVQSADPDGKKAEYRSYEGIVYVPSAYYEAKTINGYKTDTAPIFLPNSIGGYMPGAAYKPGEGMDKMHNSMIKALSQGFVVAAPGARGRRDVGPFGSNRKQCGQ